MAVGGASFSKLLGEDLRRWYLRNVDALEQERELERVTRLEEEYLAMGWERDGDDPVVLEEKDAIIIRTTERALLVAFGPITDFWIPKSALHKMSDTGSMRADGALRPGPGQLVIKKWFARKAGLL